MKKEIKVMFMSYVFHINTLLRVRGGGGTKSSFDFRRLSFNIIRAAAKAIFVRLFACVRCFFLFIFHFFDFT